jgi:hypothetical protein
MTSSIERLPAEVFDIIALDIDLPAYQHLRLASRRLHSLSLPTFAKRYFTNISTTLSSPSLDRLVNVSNHASFSNAVTLFTVKLLSHRDFKVLANICDVGIFPPPKRFPNVTGVKTAHIRDEVISYNDIINGDRSRHIADRLMCILKSLGKLKAIRLRALHNETTEWERVGASENNQIYRSRCFQAVIDSVAQSKIQLEELSMAQRKRTTTLCKQADIKYLALQIPSLSLPLLQHSFLRLHSLTLAFVVPINDYPIAPVTGNEIARFVNCASNLRNLTLSLDRRRNISHQSAAIFHDLATSCRITSLNSFQLLNSSLQDGDLSRFVTEHAMTLRSLVINNVRQRSGSWVSFWTSLKTAKVLRSLQLDTIFEGSTPLMLYWKKKMRIDFKLDAASSGRTMCDMLDELIAAYSRGNDLSADGHDAA